MRLEVATSHVKALIGLLAAAVAAIRGQRSPISYPRRRLSIAIAGVAFTSNAGHAEIIQRPIVSDAPAPGPLALHVPTMRAEERKPLARKS